MSKPTLRLEWKHDDKEGDWHGPTGLLGRAAVCVVFRVPGGFYAWHVIVPGLSDLTGHADTEDAAKLAAEQAVAAWLDEAMLEQKETK